MHQNTLPTVRTLLRKASVLAVIFCTLLLGLGVHAQSNSEYTFAKFSAIDGRGYNNNGDVGPSLSMDCLAANGFGQWTLSLGSPSGWYLLGNTLFEPSTKYDSTHTSTHPACIPPGDVDHGIPSPTGGCIGGVYQTDAIATTSLDGSINYVSVSDPDSRRFFIIEGFGLSDIDISLHGIPNPATSRLIIKDTIHGFRIRTDSAASTNYHAVFSESDYHDDFDAKSDSAFLYITWCSNENSDSAGKKEVWVTVLDITTKATVAGFPRAVGFGERPTIDCDARSNRNGGSTPRFMVAYITKVPAGAIASKYWNGSSFINDIISNTFTNPAGGGPITYTNPTHVRALMSSVLGSDSTMRAIYAIVENNGLHLILYKPSITVAATALVPAVANYVDGALFAPPGNLPYYATASVLDKPIVAFANPYDNQSGVYDQFHCLYQLNVKMTVTPKPTFRFPLLIVKGYDNGRTANRTLDTNDTRLVLNGTLVADTVVLLSHDPDTYVGAVNQMGIHVHWRASGTHYYLRDLNRTFDEPIDEHTLVTGICKVTKGTKHGGTLGTTIIGSHRMTLWTDPSYGHDDSNIWAGLYSPINEENFFQALSLPSIGTLAYAADSGLVLQVGDGAPTSSSTLTLPPFFHVFFYTGNNWQGVRVDSGSSLDYFGVEKGLRGAGAIVNTFPFSEEANVFRGLGFVALDGAKSRPANLYVHAGANFHMGEPSLFTSNHGNIQILYDSNIYPLNTDGHLNPAVSGIMTLEGLSLLDSSTVVGHFPSYVSTGSLSRNYMIRIPASDTRGGSELVPSDSEFVSSHTHYSNDPSTGLAQIRFDSVAYYFHLGGYSRYLDVVFDKDTLTSTEITAVDPLQNFSVFESKFSLAHEAAVHLEKTDILDTSYGHITISGNDFGYLEDSGDCEIFLDNFNRMGLAYITVSDNTLHDGHPWADGIHFERTDGVISDNIIGPHFGRGIVDIGPFSGAPDNTLICHNRINTYFNGGLGSGIMTGMYTAFYQGYVKLDTVQFSNEYGYNHDLGGASHLVFTTINSSGRDGIRAGFRMDMAGVHHNPSSPATGDIAGYNSVFNNQRLYGGDGQITLLSPADLWLSQSPTSAWTVFGKNNIYYTTGASDDSALIYGWDNTTILDGSNNYWGIGHDPSTSDTTIYWPYFHFASSSVDTLSHASGISCGGLSVSKDKGPKPMSVVPYDTCHNLPDLCEAWSSDGRWDDAYDTIRYYIQHCYAQADPIRAFDDLGGCAANSSRWKAPGGQQEMRNWLFSVLPLRSDNPWFCWCVRAFANSYPAGDDKAALAILKFLLDNSRCNAYQRIWGGAYSATRTHQIHVWQDTAKDNNMKYFDSTLPTLSMLGLDSLLKYASVARYDVPGSVIITNARVTTNPFEKQTSVVVTIAREAFVHFDVYDLLGRKLDGIGYEGTCEPGSTTIPLPMSSMPSGTYYLRIWTANNEVQTIKLTKE